MSKFSAGADRDRPDRRVLVRGVHEVRQPVRAQVHDPRHVLQRQRAPARVAGAHRGGQRRHGGIGVSQEPGCKSASTTQSACQAADVTMNITNQGLPIHDDATFAIRPRIFLEGNFFVDVSPGHAARRRWRRTTTRSRSSRASSPSSSTRSSPGCRATRARTSRPCSSSTARRSSRAARRSTSRSSTGCPPTSTRRSSPTTRSASSPTTSRTTSPPRARSPAPSTRIPQNLENLITDFNTTANAFARENTSLEQTVAELPKTLSAAIPAFNALNAAFPPLRAFARAMVPGREVDRADGRRQPAVRHPAQRPACSPPSCAASPPTCGPTVPALAKLTKDTIPLMRNEVRPDRELRGQRHLPVVAAHRPRPRTSTPPTASRRARSTSRPSTICPVWPASRATSTPTVPTSASWAPAARSPTRLQPGLFGQSLTKLDAVQPQVPPGGKRPPYEESVPCETQKPITNLAAPASGPIQQTNSSGAPRPPPRRAGRA